MAKVTWTEDPQQLAHAWKGLEREHSHRAALNKATRRLYFDMPETGTIDVMVPYKSDWQTYDTIEQCAYNLTRMVIDSVAPVVCEPMRVVVEPVGADHETLRSCQDMGYAVSGVMEAAKYWEVAAPIAYRDGSASDLGTVLWYVDGAGEVRCRNVNSNCVFFHFDEEQDPYHIYYKLRIPRIAAKTQFPGHDEEIDGLPESKDPTEVGVEYPSSRGGDCITVLMAYRKRLGDTNGRCVVMGVGGKSPILYDNPWKFDFFPSAHWRYDWDSQGFGGYSGARVLAPYHWKSDKLIAKAYEGLDGAVPTIMANEAERDDIEFSDKPWRKIWYKTAKPDVYIPKTVSADILAEIAKLKDTAFFAYGQSMQAAQGLRPAGLNSAPAQREWVDIKNQRLARLINNYGMMATDSARIIVALASDAYKNKSILAKAPGTDFFKEIKWPKDLREQKYRIKFVKASEVPDTVAGRIEFFGELRDRGAVTEAEYVRGIGLPDAKAITDRMAADADYVDMQISKALEDREFIMPDEMQGTEGLDMLVQKGRQDYLRVQARGMEYPRENLECLRRLVKAGDARRKGMKATVPMPVPAVLPGQPAGVQPMPSAVLPPAAPPQAQLPAIPPEPALNASPQP